MADRRPAGTDEASASDSSVHVLVVAYGSPDDLATCLGALGRAFPVTVVDNSSSHAVREVATAAGARYIDPDENLGFGTGVNRGLAEVDLAATDVLLLNPDAVVTPEAVGTLRDALRRAPDVACVAPAQHRPESDTVFPARWPFPTPWRAWAEALGLGRLAAVRDVEHGYLVASVLLVRGRAFADVGGFDEGFFLYAEEADWERRALGRGWRVAYCPEASATHAGAATDQDPRRHELRFHAGVERYLRRWHGRLGWHSYQLATVLTALRRAILPARRHRSLELAALYARGPYRRAVQEGVVPVRRHHVPTLSA